ncbi:hypothetical protein BDQ12DRAFT_590379, partial [Crucibulum laeve]
PHPDQGGQRITREWLLGLMPWDCTWHFQMTAHEINHMFEALSIPTEWVTATCSKFDGIEALCLLLTQLCSAGDMYLLLMQYDCSQSAISEIINELVIYLDERWKHLPDCDCHHLLHPSQLAQYAEAIHMQGSPLPSIFRFIDSTIRHICHPTWFQWQAYSGHKKSHALKFQAIML